MNKQDIMVTIRCLAYNHEPYIRKCLDGFVMQKTNFRFEAIVHDDASTDGTAKIIKEYADKYPNLIKPIFEIENQYSKKNGSLTQIMDTHTHGKYIAVCEGDDYWIDPYKLQKQVDILQKDENSGLCYSKSYVYNQKLKQLENYLHGSKFNNFEELLLGNKIPTLTTLYRKDLYNKYINEINPDSRNWLMGDYPMWLWFSYNSKIVFLDEITTVYRVLENSASHSNDIFKKEKFENSVKEIRLFFLNKYLKKPILEESINDIFYRTNLYHAERQELRDYCLKNLKLIKNKNFKEYIKLLLYKTKWGFSLSMKMKSS